VVGEETSVNRDSLEVNSKPNGKPDSTKSIKTQQRKRDATIRTDDKHVRDGNRKSPEHVKDTGRVGLQG
jgi:hypothetical protein